MAAAVCFTPGSPWGLVFKVKAIKRCFVEPNKGAGGGLDNILLISSMLSAGLDVSRLVD